jgi:hypothetical protein
MTKIEGKKPTLLCKIKEEPITPTLMTGNDMSTENCNFDPHPNSTKRSLSELDICSQQSDIKKLKLSNDKCSLPLSQVNIAEIEDKYLAKRSSGKIVWWNLFRKCVIYLDRFSDVGSVTPTHNLLLSFFSFVFHCQF